MKKLILLLVVALSLFLSCKKAEEPYRLNATEIILKPRETFKFIVLKGNKEYRLHEFGMSFSHVFIGEIDTKGIFTALMQGKTILSVETETSTLRCEITVK
jgi:hypothetical protein